MDVFLDNIRITSVELLADCGLSLLAGWVLYWWLVACCSFKYSLNSSSDNAYGYRGSILQMFFNMTPYVPDDCICSKCHTCSPSWAGILYSLQSFSPHFSPPNSLLCTVAIASLVSWGDTSSCSQRNMWTLLWVSLFSTDDLHVLVNLAPDSTRYPIISSSFQYICAGVSIWGNQCNINVVNSTLVNVKTFSQVLIERLFNW